MRVKSAEAWAVYQHVTRKLMNTGAHQYSDANQQAWRPAQAGNCWGEYFLLLKLFRNISNLVYWECFFFGIVFGDALRATNEFSDWPLQQISVDQKPCAEQIWHNVIDKSLMISIVL
jgi:hypothetical protein